MKKFVILFFLVAACQPIEPSAQTIIDQSIARYGGSEWSQAHLNFRFRNHTYTLKRDHQNFIYTRQSLDDSLPYKDVITSSGAFTRTLNELPIALSDSLKQLYASSVNSVLYFVQLPYILNDGAVIKERLMDSEIAGQSYYTLKITFQQEGGGEDYRDAFRYWIHQTTYEIDYMAYNYQTSGGGTRFRVTTSKNKVAGLTVQDYDNYKADEKFPPLDSLPVYFERGNLQKVSSIINTDWTKVWD